MSDTVEGRRIALDRAVLNELTKSLNGSTDTPEFNIQRLLDASEYQMDAEIRMDALGDDDWEEVKMNRDNETLPSDHFVRLYDDRRSTIYHIWRNGFGKSSLEPEVDSNDVSPCIDYSSTEGSSEEFDRQEVHKVLNRLTLENGKLLPSRYQDWIAKKLQSRFLAKNDISGYANVCEPCRRVLTHSQAFYESIIGHVSEMDSKKNETKTFFEAFYHYATIEALHASARMGCHLCSLLTSSQHSEPGTCDEHCHQFNHLEIHYYSAGKFLVNLNPNGVGMHCEWTTMPREGMSTLKHATTNAPEVMNLAKRWLTRCLREDWETCMISTRFLPSRLVEIATKHDALYSVRVVLQNELPADVEYLTLSHCWGTTRMVKLEAGTYKNYRVQLPLSSLSKTFRDALKVTAWLGYQYIWIDSLCILQDSTSDWENEAAVMGAIYRNSTCTIAATGAEDGDGGLFFKRSALTFEPCLLYQTDKGNFSAESQNVWPRPLSNRAWAVQERYLLPRVLSFGSDKISWSCGRTGAFEGAHAHRVELHNEAFPRLLDPQTDESTAFDAWRAIVRAYSGCDLTYWKDRRPAFQGLAKAVSEARDWKIVHGLRSHLLDTTELLWCTYSPEIGTIDLGEPSWSWLNVKNEVDLRGSTRSESPDAAVVLQESSAREDPEDGIMTGVIRIKSRMNEFKSYIPTESSWSVGCTVTVSNPQFEPQDAGRSLRGFWFPDTLPRCSGELWALQILTSRTDSSGKKDFLDYSGLVVVAVEGRPGFWRRVGMYTTRRLYKKGSECIYPWTHEKTTIYLI